MLQLEPVRNGEITNVIDPRCELVKLAALIDWEIYDREWVGFFPSTTGRPATSPRLVAGLLYLQHARKLSGGADGARWVELQLSSLRSVVRPNASAACS